MERVIPSGMRESLERNRSSLNSIFEYHRPVNSEPDYDDILSLFYRMILPVYEKGSGFTDDLLCGLFDTVLKLSGKGYIGKDGRFRDVEEKFFLMLNLFPELLAGEKNFTTALYNGLFNLYSKSKDAMDNWSDRMILLGCNKDFDAFKRNGFILAWRYGITRYRAASLEMLHSLKTDDIRIIFDMKNLTQPDLERFLSSLKNNPWAVCGEEKERSGPVFLFADGFTGYGGHFKSIPDVFSADGDLFAADGNDIYRIFADSFGVELLHEPDIPPGKASGNGAGMVYGITGKIVIDGKSYELPGFSSGNIRSSASVGHTSAWTLQSSYKIFIAGIRTVNG
jgi:hypothetical protein